MSILAIDTTLIEGTHGLSLAERYALNEVTGCWIFLGSRDRDGYGHMGTTTAHRYFYEALIGPVPDGLELDHLCVRTNCVNPEHLEPVTGAVNLLRAEPYRMRRWIDRTACDQGHEYNDENTIFRTATNPDNGNVYQIRNCRVCARIRKRARRQKQRNANGRPE